MEILSYIAAPKGAKLGHFQICMPEWRDFIIDMTLFQKGTHRWVSFPTRKYQKDGKDVYKPEAKFKRQETHKAFETKVLQLLDEFIAKQVPPEAQNSQTPQQFDLF